MRRCSGRDGYQDHEKRNERSIKRRRSDRGKKFAIAIEYERKSIDNLVADKCVPRFDDAKDFSTHGRAG